MLITNVEHLTVTYLSSKQLQLHLATFNRSHLEGIKLRLSSGLLLRGCISISRSKELGQSESKGSTSPSA